VTDHSDPRLDGGVIVHFDGGFCTKCQPEVVTTAYLVEGNGSLTEMGLDGGPVTHGPSWLTPSKNGLDVNAFLSNEKGPVRVIRQHGPQLVDLWAAHRALAYLVANGYGGPTTMVGDGRHVIGFLNGENRLVLSVGDPLFAEGIKAEIAGVASNLRCVHWCWIPRDHNRAVNKWQAHAKEYAHRKK